MLPPEELIWAKLYVLQRDRSDWPDILNLLYDPRIKPGMTVEEVKAVLPEALIDVRAWVRKVNDLPQ